MPYIYKQKGNKKKFVRFKRKKKSLSWRNTFFVSFKLSLYAQHIACHGSESCMIWIWGNNMQKKKITFTRSTQTEDDRVKQKNYGFARLHKAISHPDCFIAAEAAASHELNSLSSSHRYIFKSLAITFMKWEWEILFLFFRLRLYPVHILCA